MASTIQILHTDTIRTLRRKGEQLSYANAQLRQENARVSELLDESELTKRRLLLEGVRCEVIAQELRGVRKNLQRTNERLAAESARVAELTRKNALKEDMILHLIQELDSAKGRAQELRCTRSRSGSTPEMGMENTLKARGVLPICMHCHAIRDDGNNVETWERIEEFLTKRTQARLSHGVCPNCYESHFCEEEC